MRIKVSSEGLSGWLQLGLAWIGVWSATPAWSAPLLAPSALCELAGLRSDEAVEKVAESYLGLLEFGGELFSAERLAELAGEDASVEKYFELVPTGDQRSVSLNESLTTISEWMASESGRYGVSAERLRLRLRKAVQAHLSRVRGEAVASGRAREAQATLERSFFDFSPHAFDIWDPLFVDGGRRLITLGRDRALRVWDLAWALTEEPEWERGFPVEANQSSLTPKVEPLPNPNHLLLAYPSLSFLEVWDWQKRERVGSIQPGFEELVFSEGVSGLSPSGRYYIGTKRGGAVVVIDLETRQVSDPVDEAYGQASVAAWTPDSTRFVGVFKRNNAHFAVVFSVSVSSQGIGLERVFSAPIADRPVQVFFGTDDRTLYLGEANALRELRLEGRSQLAEGEVVRRQVGSATRVLDRLRGRFFSSDAQDVRILSLDGLAELGRLPGPTQKHRDVLHLKLSPSGRFLAVGYQDAKTIWVWDLETRRVATTLEFKFRQSMIDDPFVFSQDERWLLVRGPLGRASRLYLLEAWGAS